MIIASHSTSRSLFNNDPQPALITSLSSKTRTAASTASTADPPSCQIKSNFINKYINNLYIQYYPLIAKLIEADSRMKLK